MNFQRADLTVAWKVPDNFADLISCSLVLEHIRDIEFIFNQARKKLRNGGIFFLSELHPFKQYLGSKARFELHGEIRELLSYVHHVSDYLGAAGRQGLELVELREWFDGEDRAGVPRLIGISWRKG